jgi:hypothetical protein
MRSWDGCASASRRSDQARSRLANRSTKTSNAGRLIPVHTSAAERVEAALENACADIVFTSLLNQAMADRRHFRDGNPV